MEELLLNEDWKLREEPLSTGREKAGMVSRKKEGWMEATVPGDIHIDLIRENIIDEPLKGLNSFDSEWIEDRSWWYYREFKTRGEWLEADKVELELNGLDAMADIFVNNIHLGQHLSTFRPFIQDIKELLQDPGENNFILVRLTTGLEYFSEDDISEIAPYVSEEKGHRGDKRRAYVRKPQYSFGWDWNPRVPTCGITGKVKIKPLEKGEINSVNIETRLKENNTKAELKFKVNIESLDWIGTHSGKLHIKMTDESGKVKEKEKEIFLRSGFNFEEMVFNLEDPRLWWPHQMGEQHQYQVKIKGEIEGYKISYPEFKYGVRTVELDQSKINEKQRLFAIKVNGVRTYCKGANWIPADSIYGRIDTEKYETLIEEAAAANFNMLRVWGGGLYEKDCFYEFCDREGIMVWQDFMFSCAAYPDREDWFAKEVKKEIDYQSKRLRNHPSLVVWSGSNENNWGFLDWWNQETRGGARIYNQIIPEIIDKNCPDIPYWNGSPYGGQDPNSAEIGDRHHWHDCMMNEDMKKRITPQEYDKVDPKFISEYGYIGPSPKSSILKYLGDQPFARNSEAWQHHNNTFEKDTVEAGIKKHYKEIDDLSKDEYLLYAGLCQGMMLEYSLDSFRSRFNCSGGLFWMYNDCWGEVGWTIIDYYLNRKISYNFVRRANSPLRIIMREREGEIKIIVANDLSKEIIDIMEFGYISFDGKQIEVKEEEMEIPAFSRKTVTAINKEDFIESEKDLYQGCLFARFQNQRLAETSIFKAQEFKNLKLNKPEIEINNFFSKEEKTEFLVTANNFVHAVHFNLGNEYKLSDEYFDLLPEESKKIRIKGGDLTREMINPEAVFLK